MLYFNTQYLLHNYYKQIFKFLCCSFDFIIFLVEKEFLGLLYWLFKHLLYFLFFFINDVIGFILSYL